MHSNDDTWSDWTAAGTLLPSDAPFAEPDGPPGEDLLAFLSDFRDALSGTAPVPGTAAGHEAPTPVPAPSWDEPEPWIEDPYLGSDRQVAPGWWMASDRRWYPAELHPDHQVPAASAPAAAPAVHVVDARPAAATSSAGGLRAVLGRNRAAISAT